jgi:hypothetical protein
LLKQKYSKPGVKYNQSFALFIANGFYLPLITEFSRNIKLIFYMQQDRRKFLRRFAMGTGALAAGLPALAMVKKDEEDKKTGSSPDIGAQQFNMSGYAAPKIETVRVGIIGLGMRVILKDLKL